MSSWSPNWICLLVSVCIHVDSGSLSTYYISSWFISCPRPELCIYIYWCMYISIYISTWLDCFLLFTEIVNNTLFIFWSKVFSTSVIFMDHYFSAMRYFSTSISNQVQFEIENIFVCYLIRYKCILFTMIWDVCVDLLHVSHSFAMYCGYLVQLDKASVW